MRNQQLPVHAFIPVFLRSVFNVMVSRLTSVVFKLKLPALFCYEYSVCFYEIPITHRKSLLGMRQMSVRKISRPVTNCYYPSCTQSHSALAHHSKCLMFSVCIVAELSVAPTSSNQPTTELTEGAVPWSV